MGGRTGEHALDVLREERSRLAFEFLLRPELGELQDRLDPLGVHAEDLLADRHGVVVESDPLVDDGGLLVALHRLIPVARAKVYVAELVVEIRILRFDRDEPAVLLNGLFHLALLEELLSLLAYLARLAHKPTSLAVSNAGRSHATAPALTTTTAWFAPGREGISR